MRSPRFLVLVTAMMLLAAASAMGPERARAQTAALFVGALPGAGQMALLTTVQGTRVAQLVGDLGQRGCVPESVGVVAAGRWRMHINGAPGQVNDGPSGLSAQATLEQFTPFFVRCQATSTGAPAAPPPSAITVTFLNALTDAEIGRLGAGLTSNWYRHRVAGVDLTNVAFVADEPCVLAGTCQVGSSVPQGYAREADRQILTVHVPRSQPAGPYSATFTLPDGRTFAVSGTHTPTPAPQTSPGISVVFVDRLSESEAAGRGFPATSAIYRFRVSGVDLSFTTFSATETCPPNATCQVGSSAAPSGYSRDAVDRQILFVGVTKSRSAGSYFAIFTLPDGRTIVPLITHSP